jgi:hypothetical protein
MSVNPITSGSNVAADYWQAKIDQRRQAMSDLASSLQSGDLNAAQQDFAKLFPGAAHANADAAGANAATAPGGGSLKADVQALAKALQSGDLGAAQTAFARLQTVAHSHGHHHHHGGGGVIGEPVPPAPVMLDTDPTRNPDGDPTGFAGPGGIDLTA